MGSPFHRSVEPDADGFFRCLAGERPERVHNVELYQDFEINRTVAERFQVWHDVDWAKKESGLLAEVAIQRFLGYDYVSGLVGGIDLPLHRTGAKDTASLERASGREFVDLESGPIATWEDFEKYPWPTPNQIDAWTLEWYEENLPDGFFVMGRAVGHFAEFLVWLTGYETLCTLLYEDRDLLRALAQRMIEVWTPAVRTMISFPKVRAVFASDDMGFRTGTLISPDDLREFVLPGHEVLAKICHDAGRPYFLHSCGQIESIMPDLLDEVKIDARHSFEDNILPVTEAYARYGDRIGIFGGMDLDFMCRSTPEQVRARARDTLDACFATGRYFLGTGNSVANYVPVENYLAMLDEGRNYA